MDPNSPIAGTSVLRLLEADRIAVCERSTAPSYGVGLNPRFDRDSLPCSVTQRAKAILD
ncbi:hypothetical protein JCM18899A_54110 [Nocardioides sp. AN3]